MKTYSRILQVNINYIFICRYRKTIREKSNVLRDQPLKPIDNAMFWIEHVIRHKGAAHFKCAAQDLTWYQLYLVDVFAFTFGVLTLLAVTFTCLFKKLCKKSSAAPKKDKKKKTH